MSGYIQAFFLVLNPNDWLAYIGIGRSLIELSLEQTTDNDEQAQFKMTLQFLTGLNFFRKALNKAEEKGDQIKEFVADFLQTYLNNINAADCFDKLLNQ